MNLLQNLRVRLRAARNAHEWQRQIVKLRERNQSLQSHIAEPSKIHNRDVVWVFGGGRTGSSWLAEMLSEAFDLTLWFEPRLGSMFDPKWLTSQGGRGYAFDPKYEGTWMPAIREFILRIGTSRFPDARGFIIKETAGSVA